MLMLIYGQEAYLVHRKLEQIIARAREQGIDATNTAEIEATETELPSVREHISAAPFLADKRLVVISNWLMTKPAAESDELADLLDTIPDTTLVTLVESGDPDRRRHAFKKVEKLANKSWHFGSVDEQAAVRYVQSFAKELGSSIKAGVASKLVSEAGTDLWTLYHEVAKLATDHSEITPDVLEQLVVPNLEGNIFRLVDELGRRNLAGALPELHSLLTAGEPPLRILAMIIRQYRILIMTKSLTDGGSSEGELARRAGVRPFLVSKLKLQAGSYTPAELRALYEDLLRVDTQLKTTGRDPVTVLELFVAEACGKSGVTIS